MNSDEISQPKRTRFYIKSFGITRADCQFSKLPKVVRKSQLDLAGEDILGFFIWALDRPPRMTGSLFLRDPSVSPFGAASVHHSSRTPVRASGVLHRRRADG